MPRAKGSRSRSSRRADFGSGTSSASSKLVHGGLRYLRLGDVRLVREAHRERRTLAGPVAPHLVHRLPFLLPLYREGPFRPAFVQSGIILYSTLARSRLNWLVQPERAAELVPLLRRDGLRSCALYADAWTNDARLCLENVLAAAEAGATVVNRAEVVSLRLSDGRVAGAEVLLDGAVVDVAAHVTINAAGPWVDEIRRLEDPRAGTSVRLSKGAHVLVPGGQDWTAALTIPQDDVRVTFAVPWYGLLLLGTTDFAYDGDPSTVAASEEDITQILDEAATALPPALLDRGAVRASFAGLRVLPLGDGVTADARRETVFSIGPAGMLSVAGGKLTTYRRIALAALDRVRGPLDLRRIDRHPFPLPGARGGAPPLPGRARPGRRGAPPPPLRLAGGGGRRARDPGPVAPRAPPSRAGRTSQRRRCSRSRTSGPRRRRTSCAAGRRSRSAASPTRGRSPVSTRCSPGYETPATDSTALTMPS